MDQAYCGNPGHSKPALSGVRTRRGGGHRWSVAHPWKRGDSFLHARLGYHQGTARWGVGNDQLAAGRLKGTEVRVLFPTDDRPEFRACSGKDLIAAVDGAGEAELPSPR